MGHTGIAAVAPHNVVVVVVVVVANACALHIHIGVGAGPVELIFGMGTGRISCSW